MKKTEDHTPEGFQLPVVGCMERCFKRPARRILYPPYNWLSTPILRKRFDPTNRLRANLWLWGQRGNDYEANRRRVKRFFPLADKKALIVGCGTGRDIFSWLPYRLNSLTCIDYFNYEKAWGMLQRYAQSKYPGTNIIFSQGDLVDLDTLKDRSFDLVGSDAVFEHLKNLPKALSEFHRILVPGGIVYATFGPLWYCWGGDHISGYDNIASGFNHLVLDREAYENYLKRVGEFTHSEDDGRTWIKEDMFSYLRPHEYLAALEAAGFKKLHTSIILEPRAVRCLRNNPELNARLIVENKEFDLIVIGMTIIFRKSNEH